MKNSVDLYRNVSVVPIISNDNISDIVSVCIPTFKRVRTLRQTLESLFSQIGDIKFNIVVSDNYPERGDETELFMSQFNDMPGLRYYKYNEAMSPMGNWNWLLLLCDTPYMVMLHDDDCLLPNYMVKIMKLMEKYPSAAQINVRPIIWNGETISCQVSDGGTVFQKSLLSLFYRFSLSPTGALLKVNDILETGGYDPDYLPAGDYASVVSLLKANKQVLYYDCPLFLYRCVGNDTSNPETQRRLAEIDTKIKTEIGLYLGLSNSVIRRAVFFQVRMHELAIKKNSGQKKNIADYCFLLFAKLYDLLIVTRCENKDRIA